MENFRVREPSILKSLRFSREQWEKINDLVDGRNCPDFSHAARMLFEAGLWLHENKTDLEDPEKSQKLIQEYNSKMNEKDVFDWVAQLSDLKIQGLQITFDLEKEKRITSKS